MYFNLELPVELLSFYFLFACITPSDGGSPPMVLLLHVEVGVSSSIPSDERTKPRQDLLELLDQVLTRVV